MFLIATAREVGQPEMSTVSGLEIRDHQVRMLLPHLAERLLSDGFDRFLTALLQHAAQKTAHLGFIVRDKDTRRATRRSHHCPDFASIAYSVF